MKLLRQSLARFPGFKGRNQQQIEMGNGATGVSEGYAIEATVDLDGLIGFTGTSIGKPTDS